MRGIAESNILAQVSQAARADVRWQKLLATSRGDIHLAVMVEPFLSLMLKGEKTVESRFSKNKVAPYEKVKTGDLVLLKVSSGPVVGAFTAGQVQFIELSRAKLRYLQDEYSKPIGADDAFWIAQRGKRYATLIEITALMQLPPLRVGKRNMLGWMSLS